MSVLNQSGEEQVECPLCMEPLEVDDLHFYPCTCGYQICRFCWNRIREGENGLCPACRKAYPENPADFTPLSQEQVAAIKTEKKAREQKKRNKTLESRRALANVRVVQNNLVFVVGLPVRLADPETLKRQEYFGKYGKIHKVVINQSNTYAGSQGPSASAYVTYVTPADALRAIQGVNNVTLDGRVLKGSLGTTKYCANFMKNQPCPKPDCMYLHEMGDPKASFTKEEMHAGLHQVYERKLHNQLLASTQAQANANSGNSSSSSEKGSSKDGNQPNLIQTTIVTSSNINIVNSTKSKKESSGSSSSSNSNHSNGNKEAWPSLGCSPPTGDSPARKQTSPKPQQNAKSQENGTSEYTNGTQQQKSETSNKHSNKENHTEHNSKSTRSNKENGTSNNTKKSKNTDGQKNKKKAAVDKQLEQKANHINVNHDAPSKDDNMQDNFLSNELDELKSERNCLLENYDLRNNSDSCLLDDETHNLLDANSDAVRMQRHKEMMSGFVDNNNLMQIKSNPLIKGFGLLDRETMTYLGNDRHINHSLLEKEALLRDRSRSEMLMRQNEMLSRQHNVMVEPKHYMPNSSISLENGSELLGANYHPNPNMLPPFGMRVDSLGANMNTNGMGMPSNMHTNGLNINTMGANTLTANTISSSMASSYIMHNRLSQSQQQMMQQSPLVNGFDTQSATEGRYLAENMDKFFTDFHKAQQMRMIGERQHSMLAADRLEMEHKHRISTNLGARAAGDGDDDLDFDPFKETQKALAEMIESEMMQHSVTGSVSLTKSDGFDRPRVARMPPPGLGHVNAFGVTVPRGHLHLQGFNTPSAMFSDWTQMDPAIMSTSVNFNKNAGSGPLLSHQQQELFARFNQLGVAHNGVNKPQSAQPWPAAPKHSWPAYGVQLPPGFAPAKPPQHNAECIDAK